MRYRVKNTVPIDDVLQRVERLEHLMDVLDLTIDEKAFEKLSDVQKKLFEKVELEEAWKLQGRLKIRTT